MQPFHSLRRLGIVAPVILLACSANPSPGDEFTAVDVTPSETAAATPTPPATAEPVIVPAPATAKTSAQPSATVMPTPSGTSTATAIAVSPVPPALTVKITMKGDLMLPDTPFRFELGSGTLKKESSAVLDAVAEHMKSKPNITVLRVESHTDGDGDDVANLKLSDARALSVAKALVARGVECKRLMAVGFGETKPVAPNDSEANKALNRRTELFVAMLNNRAVGGRPIDGGGHVAGDPCR